MINQHQRRALRETAANWFFKLQEMEADHPERSRFERWLMESQSHRDAYSEIEELWGKLDSPQVLNTLSDGLKQRKQRIKLGKVKSTMTAMSLVVCAWLGVSSYQHWQAQPLSHIAAVGKTGTISIQKLQDGSKLTLNANTALNITYYRDKRLAQLKQGEAIFDVAPDASRPFIVDAGSTRVTVLGTRFAVNRLRALVRVSVDHGSVSVEAADLPASSGHALILHNGQVAEVSNHNSPVLVDRPAADAFSFAQGLITFNKADLPEIAETLSRYSLSPIELQSVDGIHTHVSARIKARNVQTFIHGLPDLAPVKIQQEKESIVIEVQPRQKK